MGERRRIRHRLALLAAVAALAGAACVPALEDPADTTGISLVSTTRVDGWRYDHYRNTRYPCSVSGHQTFTIARKTGSSSSTAAPLWVYLQGGGVGYFDTGGTFQPDASHTTEQSAEEQRADLTRAGLFTRVRNDAAGFRMLAVSYCNRDLYGGALQTDPNNPHRLPDGSARTTNGLLATKAAVQYAQDHLATAETFLHGTSAGSAGSFNVAWSLQRQGIAPAGVVADASIVNREAGAAARQQEVCGPPGPDRDGSVAARAHPELADIDNEVDKLVTRGELSVPLMHVWNPADSPCGSALMDCPLRDGSTVRITLPDCQHRPLQSAIAAGGAGSRSANLRLCVDDPRKPWNCDKHVVTMSSSLTNTDPSSPADYLGTIMRWVRARLADR